MSISHTMTLSLSLSLSHTHTHSLSLSHTLLEFQLRMDPGYDEEATARYMIDAINKDSRDNVEQFGVEEAQTANSLLNMSGDCTEEDDDFAPTPTQQPLPVRILCIFTKT